MMNYLTETDHPRDELEDDFTRGVMRMLLTNVMAVPANLYLHGFDRLNFDLPRFNGGDWVDYLGISYPSRIAVLGAVNELMDFYEKVQWINGPRPARGASNQDSLINNVVYVDTLGVATNGIQIPIHTERKRRRKVILLMCKSFLALTPDFQQIIFRAYAGKYRNVHLFDLVDIGDRYAEMLKLLHEQAKEREAKTSRKFKLGTNGVFEWVDGERIDR